MWFCAGEQEGLKGGDDGDGDDDDDDERKNGRTDVKGKGSSADFELYLHRAEFGFKRVPDLCGLHWRPLL